MVVGAGPNGLSAGITLAMGGRSVLVMEAGETVGGGARSAELTLPGYVHDVCSSIYPLGIASPFLRRLPLSQHGLEWVQPPAPLAHPLDDGTAVVLERSIGATARNLGADGHAYSKLITPFVERWEALLDEVLRPLHVPRHPLLLGRFGLLAMRPAYGLAQGLFRGERARALLGGMAAHSMLPLERAPSASFGLVLAMAGHAVGWPLARGGAQRIADALASYLRSLGGEIAVNRRVHSVDELPPARAIVLDLTPRQVIQVAGHRLPKGYRRRLEGYRYGPGAFKIDWALDAPIPWRAADCARAGTVHVGGTLEEIAGALRAVWRGEYPERPYVLVTQPSLFDPSRAPNGKHVAWAYCLVPSGGTRDMTEAVEGQIERFAPGFRDRILARSIMTPAMLQEHNANCVGGDINGGVQDLGQLFARPALRLVPYSTPAKGLYICSSSTPPGGGVHGMCGYLAARAALPRATKGR